MNVYVNLAPRTMDEPTAQRIFQVLWQMKKNGYSKNTIGSIERRLRNLAKHVNLDDLKCSRSALHYVIV